MPDENGSYKPLRRYSGETVVITLPDNKTIYDFDVLGVWCEQYFVDFGHTRIPHTILVPPSPRMLGVKPEVLYPFRADSAAVQPPSALPQFQTLPARFPASAPAPASLPNRLPVARVKPNAHVLLHSTVLNSARQAANASPRRRPPQRRAPARASGTGSESAPPKSAIEEPLPSALFPVNQFGARISAVRS